MRGHGKRLGIALIFCILLLPVLTSARSPDGAIRPQGLDRTSYTSYLQLPSAWRPPMVAGTGRRVPLDRSMLPHIFDPLIAAQARTRQGSQPDTNLTPTATLSEEIQPTWARDEALETIAFVSNGVDVDGLPGIDPGVTTADGTYNIWLMRPDGSQPRRLTLEDGSNELDPEYDTGSRVIAYASDKTGTYEIYTINVASGAVTQITTSTVVAGDKRHPTWSADRSLIAFQIEPTPGNWDIYTIASSGVGQPLPLITNATNDTDPTFHPSNPDVLAFTSDRTGAENIYRYERATALETQLTDGGGTATVNDKDPAWRSTGDQLAFASDRAQEPGDATADYNVWTLSWDGEVLGPPPTLKSNKGVTDTEDDENPAWSPVDIGTPPPGGGGDFVQIAFQSRRPGGQPVDDADIWSVLETDIIAPILLGMETGEAMVVEPRFAMPGDTVTLSVAVDDIDSGVAAVACQIKDPDGMVEDAEGIDHHHYIHSFGSFNGGLSGTSWIEVDFETVGLLALYDDGVPPDVTAGDNVWTGEWVTLSVPSDFLVDVITVDEAGNSQEYDNLYGFSTQLFTPQAHVLYVDDHASGQQFASTAYTIHRNVQWPGGTYHLLNWGGHAAPLLPIPPLTTPPFPEYGNVWAHNFSQSVPGYAASPYAEDVDVWRIQCRGLPPRHVIDFYGPTSEVQLSLGDYTQTRTVNVADRAIWWGAPQSGDVYATLGAITDGETQAELMRFLDRGGRLCITGGDIAWALTIDGQQGSAFLNNYLQATYVRDSLGTPDTGSMTINGTGGDPVVFGPFGHWGPSPGPPATLHTPVHPTQGYRDAYWWSQYPDVVQAGGAGVASYTYGTAGAAAVRHDAAAGYRTVYFALGFENIHREYTTNQGCLNYRGKIVHNVLCWMRTGTYTGRVLAKNGLKPISPPPVVEVLRGGTARHAVRCNQDGSWVVNGVAPATYSLRASAVGYYDHLESNLSVHGMGNLRPVRRDFVLSKAEPGGLSGTVTSAATGQPLPNVTMTAFEPIGMTTYPDPGDPPILTAADGTYAISGLPRADYEVTADGTAINYSTETQTATVLPAQNTPDVDFALTAADGTLDVTVTDSEAVPSPIPNADVQVKDAITGAPVASDITDGSGEVSFSLQPGDYLVNAGAAGYETSADQAATITPLTTTAITIALVEVPPGSISGLISRQTDGSLVDGVLVEVFSGGLKIGEATSQATPIPSIAETANYHIDPVKAGTHTVIATKSGLTMIPASRTVTVVTAQRTGDVNFQVKPLHTFPAGLTMISVPYDLSGTPVANLLGLPTSEVKLATYNPTTAAYILYPNPPADAFRLGMGYWIYLDALKDLTTSGTVATDPYRIPLLAGWNLIGDPFTGTVDYSTVMVEDSTGALMSLSDAFSAGILQSGLFTWMFGGYRTSLALAPFSGYWVLAFEQCTLVVPRPVGTLAAPSSVEPGSRAAIAHAGVEPFRSPRDGWSVRIAVTAGRAEDSDNYLGVGIDATDGYDTHYDVHEPPQPVSGTGVTAAFTGGGAAALAADIRSPAGEAKDWAFVVHADEPDQQVRVTWPDLAALPRTYDCTLVDVDGESRVSMRTQRGYTFSSGAGGVARRFLIELRQGGAGRLAVTGFVVADGRGAKTLAYTLTREARVSVQVLNVAGRVVRGLAQAQQRSAGQNELMWDLRSDNGTRVPDGLYVVRLMARSADGGAFEAARMATVSR